MKCHRQALGRQPECRVLTSWPTKAKAIAAIEEYITAFYNSWRRYTTLGGLSPMKYEAAARAEALAA